MPSTTHPTLIYEMHIFKDVDNTSWSSPQVYTFKLSAGAAVPVIRSNGSKGGLLNLRRCTPQQLAFLQSHLDAKNANLRSAREAEIETKKVREAQKKEEAQKQQKKYVEEMKLKMEKEGSEMKSQDEGQESEQTRNPIIIPAPTTFSARRPRVVNQPYDYHSGNKSAPYIHGTYSSPPSPPPPPPPPPPGFYPPPPHYRHKRREKPTPLQLESDWELESIDLDLIPIVAKLKLKQLKTTSLGLERTNDNYYDYSRRHKGNKMPRLAYQLADSAKVEFAVVYGRTVMTTVPNLRSGRDIVCYRSDSEVGEESVYEYDSEDDMAEITIGKEEGEEEEEEEEEDLEVIEGFGHCHPVTESMSKCCLEGRCSAFTAAAALSREAPA